LEHKETDRSFERQSTYSDRSENACAENERNGGDFTRTIDRFFSKSEIQNRDRSNLLGELASKPVVEMKSLETELQPSPEHESSVFGDTSLYVGINIRIMSPGAGSVQFPTLGIQRSNLTGEFGLKVCAPSYSFAEGGVAITFLEANVQKGGVPQGPMTAGVEAKVEGFVAPGFGPAISSGGGGALTKSPFSPQLEGGIVIGLGVGGGVSATGCLTININEALRRTRGAFK
jgi:hypothetical protein